MRDGPVSSGMNPVNKDQLPALTRVLGSLNRIISPARVENGAHQRGPAPTGTSCSHLWVEPTLASLTLTKVHKSFSLQDQERAHLPEHHQRREHATPEFCWWTEAPPRTL